MAVRAPYAAGDLEIYSIWPLDEPILAALVIGGIALVCLALYLAHRRSGPESRRVIAAIGVGMLGVAVVGALLVTLAQHVEPEHRLGVDRRNAMSRFADEADLSFGAMPSRLVNRRGIAAVARAVLISALLGQAAMAALDVTVTVSPTDGLVGKPSEVLVRTYAPVNAGDLALPQPSLAYPAPSGLWKVLYPVGDYPFDVVAHSPTGETTKVELGRDPSDASLWRGSVTPDVAGEWTITVSNFPSIEPTHFMVAAGDPVPVTAWVGLIGLVVGVALGMLLVLGVRRASSRARNRDRVTLVGSCGVRRNALLPSGCVSAGTQQAARIPCGNRKTGRCDGIRLRAWSASEHTSGSLASSLAWC